MRTCYPVSQRFEEKECFVLIFRYIPMQLTINGEKIIFTTGNTIRQLLEQLQLADRPVAVERNGHIVSHSVFDQTELTEGDILEVVTLVGGG